MTEGKKTCLHIYSFHFASLFCSSDVITPCCLLRLSYGCYNNRLQDTAPRVVTVVLQVSLPSLCIPVLFLFIFRFPSSLHYPLKRKCVNVILETRRVKRCSVDYYDSTFVSYADADSVVQKTQSC